MAGEESFREDGLILFGSLQDNPVPKASFPLTASTRLPYHLFFEQGEDQMAKIIMPILDNEMDIYNIVRWTTIFSDTVTIMNLSRTFVITSTIFGHINDAIKYRRDLKNEDLKQIKDLITGSNSRLAIVKCLTNRINKLSHGAIRSTLMEYLLCELNAAGLKKTRRTRDQI